MSPGHREWSRCCPFIILGSAAWSTSWLGSVQRAADWEAVDRESWDWTPHNLDHMHHRIISCHCQQRAGYRSAAPCPSGAFANAVCLPVLHLLRPADDPAREASEVGPVVIGFLGVKERVIEDPELIAFYSHQRASVVRC
jgi:hypothetical protein